MFGALGGFLPMLGMLGGGFSGGGLFSLGFTLLSGLLSNIGAPKHPGFENFATHPGFESANAHPGFGTMGNGPSVSTVGNMNGYFGSQYSSGYSILPNTPTGQYYSNAGYSYGNHALTYAPYQPQPQPHYHSQPQYQPQYYYGNSQYRQNFGNLQFGGNIQGYYNSYNSFAPSYPPVAPSYQYGQTFGSYGSAPAPYSQMYQPVVSHYGFGSPQQYNPAATLYGHQNGHVQMNYGQPQYGQPHSYTPTTYGGPQGNQPVVHNHYHVHVTPPNQGQGYETKPADTTYGSQYPAPNTPVQQSWPLVPRVTNGDYSKAFEAVGDRITGGDPYRFHMGGNDPNVNFDGMRNERMALWNVFQQNKDLRFDMKSGYFYTTAENGDYQNKFHISKVSNLVKQYGSSGQVSYNMIGKYLDRRGLYDGPPQTYTPPSRPTASAPRPAPAPAPAPARPPLIRTAAPAPRPAPVRQTAPARPEPVRVNVPGQTQTPASFFNMPNAASAGGGFG